MRVLYVVANYHRLAGAQRSLSVLLEGLDRRRVEPIVLLPGEGLCTAAFRSVGIPVRVDEAPEVLHRFGGELLRAGLLERARLGALSVAPHALRLAAWIKQERIDLAHFNDARGLLSYGLAALRARVPIVWHVRGDVRSLGSLYRWTCGLLANRIVLVADGVRPSIPALFRSKCRTVYNGIDPPLAPPRRTRRDLLARLSPPLGLPADGIIAVAVGSIVPFKGLHHLVEAARVLSTNRPDVARRLAVVIVGDRPDPAYGRYLDACVAATRLPNIRFAGWDSEPLDWIRAADLVVLPTVERERLRLEGDNHTVHGTEGFSRTVLEAMACARPVVASIVAGVPEQVADDRTGLLVPAADSTALAHAIARLCDQPATRQAFGERALDRVVERFSVTSMVEGTMRVYADLLPSLAESASADHAPVAR